ncbi:hypothetical protein F2P79_011425 [Pimephales promelas]|nr:hypothetical protein F2P79_011425 [Pimephales promelas]
MCRQELLLLSMGSACMYPVAFEQRCGGGQHLNDVAMYFILLLISWGVKNSSAVISSRGRTEVTMTCLKLACLFCVVLLVFSSTGTHATYAEAGAKGSRDQYGELAEPSLLPSL